MDAHVIEKEQRDLEQTIIQLQLQSQEQILKTTLEENQKQMSEMLDQMLKKLGDSHAKEQQHQQPVQQNQGKRTRTRKTSRPFKYCSKCHKNGHSAFKFSTHNDDECKTYP